MASVFISYDHDDAVKAAALAAALKRNDHTVWMDRQIEGGAQFGDEIEHALEGADVVVVLWSERSVKSAWVRDEAATARDSGKLIPLSIDGANPPMGFRQYQAIDLTGWRGTGRISRLPELLSAIARVISANVGAPSPLEKPVSRPSINRRYLLSGFLLAILVTASVFVSWNFRSQTHVPVVAVVAAETSRASQSLASDLFVRLGRLRAVNTDAMDIIDGRASRDADYSLRVSTSSDGRQVEASAALLGRDSTLLWSKNFERTVKEQGDLKQQLALTAARVLECANGPSAEGHKLDYKTLKLYLNGCATLSELADRDFRDLVPVFREVTRRAPQFAGGWAKLIETEAYVMGWETISRNSPEGQVLRTDIAKARMLNPRMAEAYWAEYILAPDDLGQNAAVLERATRDNPNSALILQAYSPFLRRVGRIEESVQNEKRAAELNPLSPDAASGYVLALAYAGRPDVALQELEKAERLSPGTHSLAAVRFRYDLRFGNPKEALQMLRSSADPDDAGFESYLLARINPTSENVDRAIADARAPLGRSPRAVGFLIQALAEFGRDSEVYLLIDQLSGETAAYSTETLFRPALRRFRQDPRFMSVAKTLGLLQYWKTTGKWPDFCSETDLPYSCEKEAAKLVT
ncbi:MAG: TIR domain-containing protein [Sphingomicrobium sp.]